MYMCKLHCIYFLNLVDHLVNVALAVVVIAVERETVRITMTTKKAELEEVTDEGALYRRREGGTITLKEGGVRRTLGEGTAPTGNSRGTRIVTRRGREGLDRIATEIVAMIEVVTTTEIGEGKPCV